MDTNLNINLLRVFHVAAEQGSFTRAAEKLHLTQPGVSKHIKGLEEYFATPLFDRLGRRLSLTQAGRILYEATEKLFEIIEQLKQQIGDLEDAATGELRIGASMTLGIYVLLPYVKLFQTRFPGAEISVDISLSRKVEENVLNNVLDLGFVGSPVDDARLVEGKLFDDELVLVMPTDHRWGGRTRVRVRELDSEPFLVAQPGSGTRTTLEERFRKLGVAPRMIELGHTESIKRAVESGLGVSILSRSVVQRELKLGWLKTADLQGVNLQRRFYYIHRKGKYLSKAAKAFLSIVSARMNARP